MTDNNRKLIRWDAQHIFSQDFTDYHYKLTQQHIEALMQIYPQIEWDKRWQNKALYTEDEIDAFAADLLYRLMNPVDCAEQEIDNCLEYNNNVSFLSYTPQNPHTQPDFVPAGYPNQPFFKFGSIVPEFLPDWLEDFVSDWLTEMSGYEPDDVLSVINSFPLFANWQELLESGLPRITMSFSGTGIVQIRLLLVPFGGRAIISIDVEPNIADILENLFEGNIRSIELERDFSSLPMETDIDHIEEIVLTEDIEHTIYITFLPVLDATLIPFKYGGGIRSVTLCGDFAFSEAPTDPCTIEILLDDDVFFEEEYVPATFGDLYTETIAHNEELNTAYDGTPQSIGENIPAAAPNVIQKNALCYAIHSFVKLYASSKLCIIQSHNFAQIAWGELQNAINEVYNTLANSLAFIYTPNLFSCFVDDTEAITVLQDESAIEDLACFLYEELNAVTISQSNFDDALLAAATTLTGNAGKLACIMQNDSNLTVYINFLEAYQIALTRINAGEDLECPCEVPTTYWMLYHDYRTGNKYETKPVTWNGGVNDGSWKGDGWGFNTSTASTSNVSFGFDLGASYVVRAFGQRAERNISDGSGTNDIASNQMHPGENMTGTPYGLSVGGIATSGASVEVGALQPGQNTSTRSINQRSRVQQAANHVDAKLLVKENVWWGLAGPGDTKPPGAVWAGSTLPGTVAGLFP